MRIYLSIIIQHIRIAGVYILAKKVFDSISPSIFGRSSGGGGGEEGSELWQVEEDDELFQV